MQADSDVNCIPPLSDHSQPILAACFAKKGEFASRNIAGETIVVPVRGRIGDLDSIYNLGEVASFIWNRIDGQTTVAQMVESVHTEFEVDAGTAEGDALEFIARLQSAGLIEPVLVTEV